MPLALLDELNKTYDVGIKKGLWIPAQFNDFGTPVVPIKKRGSTQLRVCESVIMR